MRDQLASVAADVEAMRTDVSSMHELVQTCERQLIDAAEQQE
jgi:hypothetical protein